jgi:uncharacterized cupin superfamily protein
MIEEAPFKRQDGALVADGDGWFVLGAADSRWLDGKYGIYTRFDSEERPFPDLGLNLAVLQPGQPACMYHGEDDQEDFLILSGECLLLIEGQERALKAWDFVHCPRWAEHVFIGAGDGPCTLLLIGSRAGDGVVYPVSELALRHGAGVEVETRSPKEAYAGTPPDEPVAFNPDWLPG